MGCLHYAHVFIVTLASPGWVDIALSNFFPNVKRLLQDSEIDVLYAQENTGGTTDFERYGLYTAASAHARGQRLSDDADGSIVTFYPEENGVWTQKIGHKLKFRTKCLKFIEAPHIEDI